MLKIYYANISLLDDEQVFQKVFEKVNIQRRVKVLQCKHKKEQMRSLMAGYLLRVALEKEGAEYDNTTISILENGKPVISGNTDLYFSLSHAGEYAACIISDHVVGVDIETKAKSLFQEGKEGRLTAVTQKIMTKREREQFRNVENEKSIELFLKVWTRKESYSKADGRGIGLGLDQVETETEQFFSKWLDDDSMISIYIKDKNFSDLQTEEIKKL